MLKPFLLINILFSPWITNPVHEFSIWNQWYIIFALLIAMLLVAFITYQYTHFKSKKELYFKDEELKKMQIQIVDLSYEIEKKNNELDKPNDEKYREETEIADLKQHLCDLQKIIIHHSLVRKDLLKKINTNKHAPKAIITDKMWEKIEHEIDIVFPSFLSSLKENDSTLSKQDVQYCCLSVYNFSTRQESILLGINPDSTRKKKTRISEKLQVSFADLNLRRFPDDNVVG